MKNVILSADGDRVVYSVPDEVAENLEQCCIEFCDKWLWTSPDAEKYRVDGVVRYNEADFIEYLNKWIFPNQPSNYIDCLRSIDFADSLPDKYKNCPQFNF